ncbi:MAG: chemotaxis signal transduction protein [Chlamydiales bacterium]
MSNLHLSMYLGKEKCSLPVIYVREVILEIIPEPVSGMPDYLSGVTRYQGELLPVLDFSVFNGKLPCVSQAGTRIVVVETGSPYGLLGVLAEKVTDTCRPKSGDGVRQLSLEDLIPEDMEGIMKACQMHEWKEVISLKEELVKKEEVLSQILFRLGNCWFAIPVHVISQVGIEQNVHRVPHRSGEGFRGIANVSGDLVLCASLQEILQRFIPIEKEEATGNRRMLVIEQKNKRVGFHVDEVKGVFKMPKNKPFEGLLSASLEWEGRKVHYLQEERVFTALTRSASHGDG